MRAPKVASSAIIAIALGLALGAPAARAEATGVSASGFTVSFAETVNAEPARVWLAFGQPARWWSSEHTWSGQAANLSLDLQAGGCWCERWGEGNSVMHGQVVAVMPGSMLRIAASLGPLQEMAVNGVLTFATAKRDGVTRLRVTYRVTGPADGALDKLAPAVDGVIGEQVKRLKAYIDTGRPN